jgi:hypothetical protein
MNFIQDDRAQAGGLIMFVAGLLLVGFFYVAYGVVMNEIQGANNNLIADSNIHYSQAHRDATDLQFKYWWGIPLMALILFVLYGIFNAKEKKDSGI